MRKKLLSHELKLTEFLSKRDICVIDVLFKRESTSILYHFREVVLEPLQFFRDSCWFCWVDLSGAACCILDVLFDFALWYALHYKGIALLVAKYKISNTVVNLPYELFTAHGTSRYVSLPTEIFKSGPLIFLQENLFSNPYRVSIYLCMNVRCSFVCMFVVLNYSFICCQGNQNSR